MTEENYYSNSTETTDSTGSTESINPEPSETETPEKKSSKAWNTFLAVITGIGVFAFGALGAALGLLGGFLTKLIFTKTEMHIALKVVITAVIWIALVLLYFVVVGLLQGAIQG